MLDNESYLLSRIIFENNITYVIPYSYLVHVVMVGFTSHVYIHPMLVKLLDNESLRTKEFSKLIKGWSNSPCDFLRNRV